MTLKPIKYSILGLAYMPDFADIAFQVYIKLLLWQFPCIIV